MEELYRGVTLRIIPTPEQEIKLWKHVGATRFCYNWAVDEYQRMKEKGIFVTRTNIKDGLTKLKKEKDYLWLNECSRDTLNEACFNAYDAMDNFYKKRSAFPRYKNRKNSRKSFKVRKDRFVLNLEDETARITSIGIVKLSKGSLYNKIDLLEKISNFIYLRCFHDGKYWYLSFTFSSLEAKSENQTFTQLTNETLGIDLGIKTLATCSDGTVYKNLNYTPPFKKVEKKIARLQRSLARKYNMNKKDGLYQKTRNIVKQEEKLLILHRKLRNMRENHLHHITSNIVAKKPKEIIIENLLVSNMVKNKYLSKNIRDAKLYEIRRQLEYKCEQEGIVLTLADTWFPSSQLCSSCGVRKTKQNKLKLYNRKYICECGVELDRDLNAAINLKNYRSSEYFISKLNN